MDCAALYKREIRFEWLEIIELRSDLIQQTEFRTFINYPNLCVSLLSIPDYRNLSQKAISVLVRLPTRGVTRLYGARSKKTNLAPPWSNLSSFEGKFTVLKNVLVTLLGLFGASSSDSAPPQWIGGRGIVPPLPPSLRTCCQQPTFARKDLLRLSKWNQKGETQPRMLI